MISTIAFNYYSYPLQNILFTLINDLIYNNLNNIKNQDF